MNTVNSARWTWGVAVGLLACGGAYDVEPGDEQPVERGTGGASESVLNEGSGGTSPQPESSPGAGGFYCDDGTSSGGAILLPTCTDHLDGGAFPPVQCDEGTGSFLVEFCEVYVSPTTHVPPPMHQRVQACLANIDPCGPNNEQDVIECLENHFTPCSFDTTLCEGAMDECPELSLSVCSGAPGPAHALDCMRNLGPSEDCVRDFVTCTWGL